MARLAFAVAVLLISCKPQEERAPPPRPARLERPTFAWSEAGAYNDADAEETFRVIVIPSGSYDQAIQVARWLHQEHPVWRYHFTSEKKWNKDRGVFSGHCFDRDRGKWCLTPGFDSTFKGSRTVEL